MLAGVPHGTSPLLRRAAAGVASQIYIMAIYMLVMYIMFTVVWQEDQSNFTQHCSLHSSQHAFNDLLWLILFCPTLSVFMAALFLFHLPALPRPDAHTHNACQIQHVTKHDFALLFSLH